MDYTAAFLHNICPKLRHGIDSLQPAVCSMRVIWRLNKPLEKTQNIYTAN
jgi:hypothetical protein